jgi:hypothetical protein
LNRGFSFWVVVIVEGCPFRRVGKQTPKAHDQAKAMKLTPELIAQAPSALNPLKERQLDLRGTR